MNVYVQGVKCLTPCASALNSTWGCAGMFIGGDSHAERRRVFVAEGALKYSFQCQDPPLNVNLYIVDLLHQPQT